MQWIHAFYEPFTSSIVSIGLLALVGLLSWRGRARKLALAACIFLFARYMLWRALFTLNLEDGLSTAISVTLLLAETYGFVQFLFFSYQAWSPTERTSPPIERYPSVDIMVPLVDEPLYILKRTLMGCLAQRYPEGLVEVYVLDDGRRPEVRALADELGVSYLSREDRSHAKAGNLNHALQRTSGELLAVFDVDHVPTPDFLERTVGFFADESVAIVQTAQDFYSPDIFQMSVSKSHELHNEQALFFRVLQAGRDGHDSAFFAGSSGLLRRSALEEIGGFQTETITEDLHTSLRLHAEGHSSRYLNEPLSTGLMPESFEGHTRQRARWAKGSAQVLVREKLPFTRGLTLAQRIDYLGSIHYFFLGLPRIIFLVAPLSWLVFSIPALRADTAALVTFFFPAYLGSVFAMRMISRNTRDAFWSDVHEIVICFAVAKAALAGLFSFGRPQTFEVTPKGGSSETRGFANAATVGWHLTTFGLMIFGLGLGIQQWFGPNPSPGLPVSLFWASVNVILLTAAIAPARSQRQVREFVRRAQRLPCLILDGSEREDAEILDVSESGVGIRVAAPRYSLDKKLRFGFWQEDELVTLEGTIVRQETEPTGDAILGVRLDPNSDSQRQTLINRLFATPDERDFGEASGARVFASAGSLFSVLLRLGGRLRPSRRQTPRLPLEKSCRLHLGERRIEGITRDASFSGVSAVFPGVYEVETSPTTLMIEGVELMVRPVSASERKGRTFVRFRVESVRKGESRWQAWHQPSSH